MRDIDDCWIKGGILKLDEELLPLGREEGEVVLNGTGVVTVFRALQLTPSVFQLRSFKCLGSQERSVGYPLSVSVEKHVMMWFSGRSAPVAGENG